MLLLCHPVIILGWLIAHPGFESLFQPHRMASVGLISVDCWVHFNTESTAQYPMNQYETMFDLWQMTFSCQMWPPVLHIFTNWRASLAIIPNQIAIFKQRFIGINCSGVCEENILYTIIPPVWTVDTKQDGFIFWCLHQIQPLPSENRSRNQNSSHQVAFSNLLLSNICDLYGKVDTVFFVLIWRE